jgi:hypothetical protein
MKPVRVYFLLGSTLLASWLGMQAVHEAGHVLGAKLTGGKIEAVCLNPLTISHTELSDNPYPFLVVWAGPVVGVVVPVLVWSVAAGLRRPGAFLLRFFAGFCLIANGAYIAGGSVDGIGDAGVMLRNGTSTLAVWVFGGTTVPAGLALWHGQSRHFGFGPHPEPVRCGHALSAAIVTVGLIAIGLLVSDC